MLLGEGQQCRAGCWGAEQAAGCRLSEQGLCWRLVGVTPPSHRGRGGQGLALSP